MPRPCLPTPFPIPRKMILLRDLKPLPFSGGELWGQQFETFPKCLGSSLSNLVVCNFHAEALFCALLRPFVFALFCAAVFCGIGFALFCAHLHSFVRICVFLRLTAFGTAATHTNQFRRIIRKETRNFIDILFGRFTRIGLSSPFATLSATESQRKPFLGQSPRSCFGN